MNTSANKIAVVGMACRFPGARNIEEYWSNLILGKETLENLSEEQVANSEPYFDSLKDNPNYIRVRGILNDVDKFDAGFFGMTPKESAETDPQQRLWFETVWEAFENAGCDPYSFEGPIGVFAGGNTSSYLMNNILRDPRKMENYLRPGFADATQLMLGNDISFIPTKTAYQFNLKGPAVFVQTACSTSLVAIAQACQSLYSYESDMCIAGGVKIAAPQEKGYMYQEGAIYSPDGHCRPFDAEAKGTVGGNGVGVVVLKRMEDAVRDHDTIYALVSGWALNNDGSNKVSYTAPSVDGQAEVIMMAQAFAEVSPDEISYVEAHGTATKLGDPIEVAALTKAFRAKTDRKCFCGLGSVKSNIGHTDSAAGVAAFIKTCLSAYNKKIPPSLHYSKPNPHIDFENSPFYVLNQLKEWNEERTLIMGVSSFGIGGTNAHVIVEQPPVSEVTAIPGSAWPDLVFLSAKSEESLKRRKHDLIEFIKARPNVNLKDVAHTLAFGRNHMRYRSFMVASSVDEIISAGKGFTDGKTDGQTSAIVFMFPGQGAQYVKMGMDLYNINGTFRKVLDECFSLLKKETETDLKSILFDSLNLEESDRRLASTELTQPALFIIEYALSKVLEELDIKPGYLIGHSIGEYTAACLSGVFDLNTGLKIVIRRGQLMSRMRAGSMMAVRADVGRIREISDQLFEIAADNAAESCTISFKSEDIGKVRELLDKKGIQYISLNTSHAFHSEAFDPIMEEFAGYVDQFILKPPEIPFISCLTGEYITREQATSGAYWAKQLRNTVRFRQGIAKLAEREGTVFLEVGPNTHLGSMVRQSKDILNKKRIISTLGKPDTIDERYRLIAVLGNLFTVGAVVNFDVLEQGHELHKIALPTYPFERKRHWIEYDMAGHHERPATKSPEEYHEREVSPSTEEITFKEGGPGKTAREMVKIWKSLFGSDEINPDDDFFEIGGHSLLALQILARIKEKTGFEISLKDFLDYSTINKLAAHLDESESSESLKEESAGEIDFLNYPLSYIQKRIWIVSQLDRSNPAYNISFSYKFKGAMNVGAMKEAINLLFNRHFIMFSTFRERDGNPCCEIKPVPVEVEMLDFSANITISAEEKITSFIGRDTRKQFDLQTGPLYRVYLSKIDNSCYVLHGTIHHIIFDGWSFGVFVSELRKIYDGLILKKDPELENAKDIYLDYARSILMTEFETSDRKSAEFWIENLKECSPRLNFPYDYARKDTGSGFGEKQFIQFTPEVTAKLKKIAREKHATPFASLLSLIGIIFQKYSGENDICIGTHVANRSDTSLEKIFGMFVNTIPVRLRIDEKRSISDLMNYTKNTLLESISHQEFPFEKIVEVVNPERFANVNPIFQVAVQWLNYSTKPLDMEGLKGERYNVKEGIAPFDISFNLWENNGKFEGEIEFNVDILKRETIVRLKDNFIHLVQTAVENPDMPVSAVCVISDNDRKMLSSFNNTTVDVPDCFAHTLFEHQVIEVPGKTAVISGNDRISYHELEIRSNQLANHLISLGVSGGDVVGICIERSVGMVVSVMAILKAGCCYLPMDPLFPDDRLAYMFEDSGAKVLISQSSLKDKFHHFSRTKIVLADTDQDKISGYSADKPVTGIDNQSLAYIIYTSGSTGKPKGVMVHHEAVVNLLLSMKNKPGLTGEDRLLAVTTLSFDISVLELFLPLSCGACLIIADSDDIFDGHRLSDLIDKHDVTVMQATPATWNILLGSGWKGRSNLKALCGGEALIPGFVREILPKVGEFWNCYGPTETVVYSTCTRITSTDAPILVGKPIDNTQIWILDRDNIEVPVGVTGEVCIGGLCVTKGYKNRPKLTAEKFINYGENGTIYKTGDLGRYLTDGNIELFGRIDNQIKLRGFRIEPGEIESLLSKLQSVQEAVVKVQKFGENDERLVAFLNVDGIFTYSKEEITSYLSQNLPVYMIPSFFCHMEGFPRLPNGKINKKALILEISEEETGKETDITSLTPTQKRLADIWGEVLGNRSFSPSDSFFNLGGTSLLAIRILNRIKEELGFSMTFKSFITHSNINESGNYIDSHIRSTEKSIDLVHNVSFTNLPLTLNQKRLWLIWKLQPDIASYIISYTYRFEGELDREIFEKSINILFNRHLTIFSVIRDVSGEPYCDILQAPAYIKFFDFTGFTENLKNEKTKEIFDTDSVSVFNLEKGPLYRLYLIRTGASEYYFRLSIHHIIFDAWSWSVMIKDLNEIYNSLIAGKDADLDPVELQQYDYAVWEQSSVGESKKEELEQFWTDNMRGASPVINFPFDYQRMEHPSGKGRSISVRLSEELSEKIRTISRAEGTSVFATMLSVFGIQMHKYSGEDDINIGLPVSYRPHTKLENIFGMFVNTVVVRLIYEKGLTFRDIIRRTGEAALNAIAHQELSFEKVVKLANPGRSSNTNPLFQISFVWQHYFNTPLNLNGIKAEKAYVNERITQFDINVYFWENGSTIEGEIEYSTDLLKHESVLRMKENFLCLLGSLVANIDSPVESIPMITDVEVNLIEGFNLTFTDYPYDKTITGLFREQVVLYSEKKAVVFKDYSLTYRQLNEKSNQLARTLIASGVKENTPVAIMAEKSADIIVGILAILKAGGGYVPVDPDYPEQRINFIIHDSGSKILLIQDKYSSINIEGVNKISLNSPASYSKDKSDFENKSKPADLAYIMYTSGTTGLPKGSMIWQKGVVRLVRNMNYIELTDEDRILLTGAIVFDASTFEIWGALLNGGTLYIADKETILSPKALGEELINNDITILWLTSALFTQIAESRTDIFRKLKYLLSGGDVLSAPHINKVRHDNTSLRVINGYGPTENTTFSTTYLIERDFESNIPIGRPVSNSTVWIFDRHMNYQPVGVVGELCVGGDGLSMGYLNRDDLNMKSFIIHPYKPGVKLYRTGDLARWLPDGNIEFHGRIDNQIKIRGFRVEPEEIAAVISELEGVVETVIKSVKIQEGDIRLVAFLNVNESFSMEPSDIGRIIKQKLPPYMVPSVFKIMHGFPTTINGKTDRNALKADVSEIVVEESHDQRKMTDAERIIYDIWSEALKTKEISVNDNFFDIGGNSLMAISVFSKMGSAFGLDLSLRVFFDSPRISELATTLTFLKFNKQGEKVDDTSIVDGEI